MGSGTGLAAGAVAAGAVAAGAVVGAGAAAASRGAKRSRTSAEVRASTRSASRVSWRVASQRVPSGQGSAKWSGERSTNWPGLSAGSASITASLAVGASDLTAGASFRRSWRVVSRPRPQVPNWAIAL